MKRINILSEDTANKIAAGEVVERPASIVKELVENSIDANAKNILIEIEDGGTSLIRVIDDGEGIYKDDILKAFMPHATSKIKDSQDIYNINTLGFRGEALPSIAAVSKVCLKTKQRESSEGYKITIEGGKYSEIESCGINHGTIIEVSHIFFNVPARKKFLKTVSREGSLITDIVTRIALANPNISIKLFNNGKKTISTFGNGELKDVIRSIYGKNISDNIIYFEDIGDDITVYGYVGKEEIARGSRNNQSSFVNKRYIKNKALAVAVEQAFKSFSTINKFPFFIMYIEIYPEFVDVNIHPTKAEIKFNDEKIVFSKIFNAVHNALKQNVFHNFSIREEKEEHEKKSAVPSYEELSFKIKAEEEKIKVAQNSFKEAEEKKEMQNLELKTKANKEQITVPVDFLLNSTENSHLTDSINENYETFNNSHINDKNYSETILKRTSSDNVPYKENEDFQTKEGKFPPITIIGQYNKTYILGEYDGTLYMIDQHAAHEKILFEKYLKQIEEGNIIIQPLFVPIVLELSSDDYLYYEENISVFKEAGFVLEEFGENCVALKEVPYFLGKLNSRTLFLEILDNLKNLGNGKTTEVKYNTIATKACKAAVKGNDYLNTKEMVALVNELRFIDDPFHCPHGRPVILRFTKTEIEKKFKRIV